MLEQIKNNALEEWQWRRIVEKMYDPSDAAVLNERFVNAIQERRLSQSVQIPTDRKLTRDEQHQLTMMAQAPEKLPWA